MQIKLTSHAALALATDGVVSSMAEQPIHLSSSSLDEMVGHWITIGAGEDEEGESHGGAHVFIREGGMIAKGPKSLTGKTIGQLKSKAGKSTLGGKGTPMERAREALRKLNESGKHANPPGKGSAPAAKEAATKLNEAIGHPAGPGVEKQVNAQREAQRAAGESEGRAKAEAAKSEGYTKTTHPPGGTKVAATSSPAARTAEFHARVKELRGQGHDTARAVAKARAEVEAAHPELKQAAVKPKPVRPAMGRETSSTPAPRASTTEPASTPPAATETPATDFHERVKQLRGQGKSMAGAVVHARMEAAERSAAAAKSAKPTADLDKARAAHAAGDSESLKKHVAAAVKKNPPAQSWRNRLRGEIKDAYTAQGGGLPVDVYQHAESLQNPFTFKRGSAYEGEVRQRLGAEGGKEGVAISRSGAVNFTDDATKSGGEDAINSFRHKYGNGKGEDYYWQLARERSGYGFQDALQHARNSPDPELRFKAAVHDSLPVGEKVGRESVDPAGLKVGEEFKINKIPVEVTENAEGEKLLRDHGDLPETPVDALRGKLAIDKGTRQEKELPAVGDDFFDEVKGETSTNIPRPKLTTAPTLAKMVAGPSVHIDKLENSISRTRESLKLKPGDDKARFALAVDLNVKRQMQKANLMGGGPELKSHAAQSLGEVDNSRQLGLYAKDAAGNPIEVGEHAGQANLFNPSKYKTAEKAVEEKVKPQFDPKHTAEMFPQGAKSEAGKSAAAPSQPPRTLATALAKADASIAAHAATRAVGFAMPGRNDPALHEQAAKLHAEAARLHSPYPTDTTGVPSTVEGERALFHKVHAREHLKEAADLRAAQAAPVPGMKSETGKQIADNAEIETGPAAGLKSGAKVRMSGINAKGEKTALDGEVTHEPLTPTGNSDADEMAAAQVQAGMHAKVKLPSGKVVPLANVEPVSSSPEVKYVRAPAGGAHSPITDKHYKGGHWMPIHGEYAGLKKQNAITGGSNAGGKPSAEGGGSLKPTRQPLSKDELERRAAESAYKKIVRNVKNTPLGGMLAWHDENGEGISGPKGNFVHLGAWKDYAESVGEPALKSLADKFGGIANPEHLAYQKQFHEADLAQSIRGSKAHLKNFPSSMAAHSALSAALEKEPNSLVHMHEMGKILADAKAQAHPEFSALAEQAKPHGFYPNRYAGNNSAGVRVKAGEGFVRKGADGKFQTHTADEVRKHIANRGPTQLSRQIKSYSARQLLAV